jgi:hypothetical protein
MVMSFPAMHSTVRGHNMNASISHEDVSLFHTPALPSASTGRARVGSAKGAPRVILRLEGAAALIGASVAYAALGGRWGWFAALFLLPDLSMLGYLAGKKWGAISYNAAHSYLGPASLAAMGAMTGAHGALLAAAIWTAHVGFDRMLGYGLKYASGFGDTHLSSKEQ